MGAELHPLRWHRDEPDIRDERAAENAAVALFDGAQIVREGARLGVDELRNMIAVHEANACAAHRATLVVASATGRRSKRTPVSTWPAGEPCVARAENEGDGARRGLVVLAERAGRRLALLCSVITDRDGLPRPSVRVAFQRHRDFEGWVSVGRELYLPWSSLPTVRAAIETTETLAEDQTAALWERAQKETR